METKNNHKQEQIETDARSPASVYFSSATRRMTRVVERQTFDGCFVTGMWGEIPESLKNKNREALATNSPIFGSYSASREGDVYIVDYFCHCKHWTEEPETHIRVHVSTHELLLATCPCVWPQIQEVFPEAAFPALKLKARQSMERVLKHLFEQEHFSYLRLPVEQRMKHILNDAATVEAWLHGTPDPVAMLDEAAAERASESS